MRFGTVQEICSQADATIEALRSAGLDREAGRIDELLHETAWTTGSELLGELGLCFKDLLKTPKLPKAVASDLKDLVHAIERILKGKK